MNITAPPMRESIRMALDELGEPQPDYPAPVANAVNLLRDALANWPNPTANEGKKMLTAIQVIRLHREAGLRKEVHWTQSDCEHPRTCGACHFWSGYIGALEDVKNGEMPATIMVHEALRESTVGEP